MNKVKHPELVTLASLGSVKIVMQKLLEGWDPNVQNEDDITPVHKAIEHNDLIMTQLLIDAGARVDIGDLAGFTPLKTAQMVGNKKMIQLVEKTLLEQTQQNLYNNYKQMQELKPTELTEWELRHKLNPNNII
jgi:ankyrin repeat protein